LKQGQIRIIGSRDVFAREQQQLGTHVDLSLVDDSVKVTGSWKMGQAQKKCGRAALDALEAGVEMLKEGRISALVTAPVSKEALRLAGFGWPGQTEFLADRLSARRHAMLAWTPRFKVVFVTIHLPLARVARHITARAVYEKTVLLDEFLRLESGAPRSEVQGSESLISAPRICVMAFNPHGYEFTLGEEAKIAVAVARARQAGISSFGPLPADAAVARLSSVRSLDHSTTRPLPAPDGFVAMYHDQAMIPAKLLGRDAGVNVTLGLGRIRTSPLHGTAFDIAGKGIADTGSMSAALALARRLARQKTDKAARGRPVC